MTFTEKDFATFRNFQNRLAKQFGEHACVGTDNVNVLVEYSPELKAMIRPLPPTTHFEFALKHLFCKDCKNGQVFLCLPDQEEYVCDVCSARRKAKGAQKKVVAAE